MNFFCNRNQLCLIGLACVALTATSAHADGCKTTSQTQKWGNVLGGALGDVLKSQLGKNLPVSNGTISSFSRALGGAIACGLTDHEQKQAKTAQVKALDGGKIGTASQTTWVSADDPAVTGGTMVTSRSVEDGKNCAVQTTFVVDKAGAQKKVSQQMCQPADGSSQEWLPVNA